MPDQLWNSWGASVIGPLHVKSGIPNQDSWMARRYKWGNVVVVSDGLGSKAHSDHGSKAACLAVFEAAKSYQNTPDANIIDILRLIHASWLVKIAPYSPLDCSATCLLAIQTEETITLGRLGDGMIVALGQGEENHLILKDNKQNSFSNFTHSLHKEFKEEYWEVVTVCSHAYHGIVLCTDGISDDLLKDMEIEFSKDFIHAFAGISAIKRRTHIKKMLTGWPVPHHSDDKTIACLIQHEVQAEEH